MDDHEETTEAERTLLAMLADDEDPDWSECLSPEDMLALVEGRMVERDALEAMRHVGPCRRCRSAFRETAELVKLAKVVALLEEPEAASPRVAPEPAPRKRWTFGWNSVPFAWTLSAAALAGLWFGYAAPQRDLAERRLAQANAEAAERVRLMKERDTLQASVAKLSDRQGVQVARLEAAEAALAEMPLPAPDWNASTAVGRVRGGDTPTGDVPTLLEPVGVSVADPRPRLTWRPIDGVALHRVVFESEGGGALPELVPAGPNAVRPAAPLASGVVYRWSVVAVAGDRLATSTTGTFRVLGSADRKAVAAARQRLKGKPLALAAFLARTGLLPDARDVLRTVRPGDPAEATARRWLASLEGPAGR